MITHLRAKNFKSWADTGDLRIAPLTGFFGTNSSGKTSLLQLLLMMKQTAESNDKRQVLQLGDAKSLVDLGTFDDLIHNHDVGNSLDISLSYRLSGSILNDWIPLFDLRIDNLRHIRDFVFNVALSESQNHVNVNEFAYKIGNYSFGMKQTLDDPDKYEVVIPNYSIRVGNEDRRVIISQPSKFFGFPDEVTNYKDASFFPQLEYSLSQTLSKISYLGPLREYPQRTYLWSGAAPSSVGTRGENAVAALLAAKTENRPIDVKIAEWLKRMGLIYSFKLEPIAPGRRDYEVRIKKTPTSAEVLITDVGFGVSQLLPVLVLCYYVPEGSIIILEQPEIHLHPSVQSDLADLLIEVVKERKVQIIFESHSEHLLRRLQRRMAEEEITPEETALYFCSAGERASQIEELQLDVDEFGNIRNWPKDFFGDEMGDLVAKTEAEMIRQGAGSL